MDDATLTRLRTELEEDRAQQLELLTGQGAEPYNETVSNLGGDEGFADSAQLTAERNERLALIDQARTRLHLIEEALGRMDDGTYGTCSNCGRSIGADRLEIRPLSSLCVECATELESA